jgi:hypothetical protein
MAKKCKICGEVKDWLVSSFDNRQDRSWGKREMGLVLICIDCLLKTSSERVGNQGDIL